MKSVGVQKFFDPKFPAFAPNTDMNSVNLRILSKHRTIRTRKKTFNWSTFQAVPSFWRN